MRLLSKLSTRPKLTLRRLPPNSVASTFVLSVDASSFKLLLPDEINLDAAILAYLNNVQVWEAAHLLPFAFDDRVVGFEKNAPYCFIWIRPIYSFAETAQEHCARCS
jgi:hypothetical protein